MTSAGATTYGSVLLTDVKTRPLWREPHTMDPRTWFRSLTARFLYALFIATIGPLLFGYHLAELNTPLEVITCKRKSLNAADGIDANLPQCIPMEPAEIGLVVSMFTLGGLIGALTAGPASSRYGRLRAMQLATLPFVVGPVFESFSPNVTVFAIGRLISGFGAGAAMVVVPIYVSEISPPEEKGFFGSFTQVMVNMGILLTQVLGFLLSHDSMWRVVLAIGGVIGLLQLPGLAFCLESPRWLVDHGHVRKARDNLRKLRGDEFDTDAEVVSWGTNESDAQVDEEETLLHNENQDNETTNTKRGSKKDDIGMFEIIQHPDHKRAVFVVIMVMIAQQMTGINSIVMYGVTLLADLMKSNSAVLNIAVSALNVVITVACAPLVDKLGRKTCLLGSTAGMGTGAFLLAIGIKQSLSILSAVAVIIFVASFALGLGPVPFILSSELVGPEAVGAAQAWALAANWIATFVVAQFFPIVNAALGKGIIYFAFTGIAIFFCLFIFYFVPETKGKRSADEVWGRSNTRQD